MLYPSAPGLIRENAMTMEAIVGKIEKTRIITTAGVMKKVPAWRSIHSLHVSRGRHRPDLGVRPAGLSLQTEAVASGVTCW